jgi:hypothetical protein
LRATDEFSVTIVKIASSKITIPDETCSASFFGCFGGFQLSSRSEIANNLLALDKKNQRKDKKGVLEGSHVVCFLIL